MSDSTTPMSGDASANASFGYLDSHKEEAQGARWTEFRQARASLAEVMTDDELRDLGFNLDVLDSRP